MSNLNIYLVEDNPLIAHTLKHIISSLGHSLCGFASSYEKAVNDLQSVKPDLVITDINLEGRETGVDLCKYINKYLNIPFIYQSSTSANELLCAAHATRPEAFLAKPVRKHDLHCAICGFNY